MSFIKNSRDFIEGMGTDLLGKTSIVLAVLSLFVLPYILAFIGAVAGLLGILLFKKPNVKLNFIGLGIAVFAAILM